MFTISDVDKLIAFYQNYNDPPSHLEIMICAERAEIFNQDDTPSHLHLHLLCQSIHRQGKRSHEIDNMLKYGEMIIERL